MNKLIKKWRKDADDYQKQTEECREKNLSFDQSLSASTFLRLCATDLEREVKLDSDASRILKTEFVVVCKRKESHDYSCAGLSSVEEAVKVGEKLIKSPEFTSYEIYEEIYMKRMSKVKIPPKK